MRLTTTLCYCVSKRIGKLTKTFSNLPESYIKRKTEQVQYKLIIYCSIAHYIMPFQLLLAWTGK